MAAKTYTARQIAAVEVMVQAVSKTRRTGISEEEVRRAVERQLNVERRRDRERS